MHTIKGARRCFFICFSVGPCWARFGWAKVRAKPLLAAALVYFFRNTTHLGRVGREVFVRLGSITATFCLGNGDCCGYHLAGTHAGRGFGKLPKWVVFRKIVRGRVQAAWGENTFVPPSGGEARFIGQPKTMRTVLKQHCKTPPKSSPARFCPVVIPSLSGCEMHRGLCARCFFAACFGETRRGFPTHYFQMQQFDYQAQRGMNALMWEASGYLPPGAYFLRMVAAEYTMTEKS